MTIRVIEFYYNSDKSLAKSKYVDIKFLVIKDKVRNHIAVDNDNIFLNIIDSLTKRLPPKDFLEHIAYMGMSIHDDILI